MVKVFTSKKSAINYSKTKSKIKGWKYVAEDVKPSNIRGFKGKKAIILVLKKK